MLINPEEHSSYKTSLDDLFSDISFLTYSFKDHYLIYDEFRWAIALDYLLLKSLGENDLKTFLEEELKDIYLNYKPIFEFKLQDTTSSDIKRLPETFLDLYHSFFENNLVNPFILRRSLFMMRTNVDLKILFSLFGGSFVFNEKFNTDGTGAIDFIKEEKKTEIYEEKLDFLRTHLENPENDQRNCIALNVGSHWVAVGHMDEKYLTIHNPNSRKPRKISIKRSIPSNFRFYLFTITRDESIIFKERFKSFLMRESEKEQENLQDFLEILIESVKEKQYKE